MQVRCARAATCNAGCFQKDAIFGVMLSDRFVSEVGPRKDPGRREVPRKENEIRNELDQRWRKTRGECRRGWADEI